MHLAGIKLPPIGSIQDGIFRHVFLTQKVRELRSTSLIVLAAQGAKPDVISSLFRDHSEDLLYLSKAKKDSETRLREQYEEMRRNKPVMSKARDGSYRVTGIE